MLLSSIQVEMNSILIRNQQSQTVQTDDGSRCFWIENQYRTDRAVKAILSHFTIHLHSLWWTYSNRIGYNWQGDSDITDKEIQINWQGDSDSGYNWQGYDLDITDNWPGYNWQGDSDSEAVTWFCRRQWCAEGIANKTKAPSIQEVILQNLKCCNCMIFPTARLPTHAAWI